MQHHKRYQVFALWLSAVSCISPSYAESLLPYDTEPSANYSTEQLETLAKKLGITDEVTIVKNGTAAEPLVLLHAENYVNKKVASAYFDCGAVSAELLQEEADIRDRRLRLEQQRNTRILTTNSTNFLSRGAISAPAFGYSINPQHLPTKGNILGSIANGTSTLLSVVALAEGRSGRNKSRNGASILAPLFFDDVPRDKITPYVWVYLNSAPLDQAGTSAGTHRQRLVSKWIKAGLAPDPETVTGRRNLLKLLELEDDGLSIADLKRRETMLQGFRTTVLQMTKGLEQLSHWM